MAKVRNCADCSKPLWECGWCADMRGTSRVGCQTRGCKGWQFDAQTDACKDCGRAHEMRVGYREVEPEAAPQTNVSAPWPIERFFLGAFVVGALVIAAVSAARFLSAPRPESAWLTGPTYYANEPQGGERTVVLADATVCSCFNEARVTGRGKSPESAEFRTGFKYCRRNAGAIASDAWTAGWDPQASGRSSCRSFLRHYEATR